MTAESTIAPACPEPELAGQTVVVIHDVAKVILAAADAVQ